MDLKATLAKAVTTAVTAIGTVAATISYHRVSVTGYDVATDSNTVTDVVISCKGVVYKSKVETQDYKKTDLIQTKVLISGEVFSQAGFVPDEQDYMVIAGVKYEIKSIMAIPSDAGFIFVVRAV